jgi:hypothetical protein
MRRPQRPHPPADGSPPMSSILSTLSLPLDLKPGSVVNDHKRRTRKAGSTFGRRSGVSSRPSLSACMPVQLLLFLETRFQFRRLEDGRPGELFPSGSLRSR